MITAPKPRTQSRYWSREELALMLMARPLQKLLLPEQNLLLGSFGHVQGESRIGNRGIQLNVGIRDQNVILAFFVELLLHRVAALVGYPEIDPLPRVQQLGRSGSQFQPRRGLAHHRLLAAWLDNIRRPQIARAAAESQRQVLIYKRF